MPETPPLGIAASRSDDLPAGWLPGEGLLERWAAAAAAALGRGGHVDLRIVSAAEMAALNETWRGRRGPTNVLSFPADAQLGAGVPLLGDLALCAEVIASEAQAQGKEPSQHWAHLVVHGVLHLLGCDHIEDADAAEMEALERQVLAGLGIPDPYAERS